MNTTPNPIQIQVQTWNQDYTEMEEVWADGVTPGQCMWGPLFIDDAYSLVTMTDQLFGNGEPFATVRVHMKQTFLAGGAVQITELGYMPDNSTTAYAVPISYGWNANATTIGGGIYTGAAVLPVTVA